MLGLLRFYSGFSVFLLFFMIINMRVSHRSILGLESYGWGWIYRKKLGCVKLFIFALKLLFQSLFNLKLLLILNTAVFKTMLFLCFIKLVWCLGMLHKHPQCNSITLYTQAKSVSWTDREQTLLCVLLCTQQS